MISGIIVLVSQIEKWTVTAPDFHTRVRWVHVFLIGLISKPCACHDALISSLSPSKTAFSLLVSLKQMPLLKEGNELPLSHQQISSHMTALPWLNLCFSCIREQFPEGKKGGEIKLLLASCFYIHVFSLSAQR